MGLQGPPYAVLSPLVTDPLAPPGDPESSLFLTCHFVFKGRWKTKCKTHTAYEGDLYRIPESAAAGKGARGRIPRAH